jgi:hypothetical protein
MGVTINIGNGNLGGTVQTNDGIVGLVTTGVNEGYTLGDCVLLTNLSDLVSVGITESLNQFAYKQVREFYAEAGSGAQLYLMLTSNLVTVAMMASSENANGVKKLLDFAEGKIKVIGLLTDDNNLDDDPTSSGVNVDVYDAVASLQVMLNGYAAAQRPLRGIIGGTSYTGAADEVNNFDEDSNNRVSILIGDTDPGLGAAVGLALGRVAKSKVDQKLSRVKTGKLAINAAYLGNTAVNASSTAPALLKSRRYICLRAHIGIAGYYFSGDETATANTDDYKYLARGRVIDKAQRIAYQTYLTEVDDSARVKADGSGQMTPNYIAYLKSKIEQAISTTMRANNEISGVTAYIDPQQNVLTTDQVVIDLGVTPNGYLGEIIVNLAFKK